MTHGAEPRAKGRMMAEVHNWRALADALTYAMTESGVDTDFHYLQGVAHDATEWLERHGYLIVRPARLNRPDKQ